MSPMIDNPRDLALEALRDRAGNVTAHLERLLGESSLSAPDRALARELALGTLRRRGTLRAVLRAFLAQPDKPLQKPLDEILQIALYQLLFLERIPEFAAVNEAVNQAKRMGLRMREEGLVNGVLRSIIRSLQPPQQGSPQPASDVIPITGKSFRHINKPVFADPKESPAQYLASAISLPVDLATRWVARLGLTKAIEVGLHSNSRAPLILRVNRLRADVPTVLAALEKAAVPVVAHANGLSVVLLEQVNVGQLDVVRQGWVQAQDATATAVTLAASPKEGMTVLDFCAAPGGKTTHLAEMMNNVGRIVAADVSPEKLAKVEENCQRLGLTIVQPVLADTLGSMPPQSFDLVLTDVPCSNTGVLARRAEARWRFTASSLRKITNDQRLLAGLAAQFVQPGGRLVYSTCSIEPEECQNVAYATATKYHMKVTSEKLILPGGADDPSRWHDGGYYAVLQA